ncbi:MAG: alpha/beta hydrolase [Acidimicrobiales bacterium]|jgi:pimeloyl-ACP methyl ester carboxylesterase
MRALRILALAVLAVAGSASLVGAGAADTASSARSASHETTTSVKWTTCPGHEEFRCASVPVPIDYANPSLGTLKLAVVMLPATGAHPLGDVFTNPGGPGASGVGFLEESLSSFPKSLRAEFNIVSWDPRGVERSDPVTCVDADGIRTLTEEDPQPSTPAQIARVVALTKQFVAACAAHTSKLLLENVGTRTTIEDLDRLRADLGQPKLDYLGFSYGTFIGELYAEKYPHHIRAMVLDGAINPELSLTAADREQALGFEGDLHAFFTWCDANKTCHQRLPDGAAASYAKLMALFEAGGVIHAGFKAKYGGLLPVTLGVAEIGVISTLYSNIEWPYLGLAIDRGLHGNGDLLAELAYEYVGLEQSGKFSNQDEANVAVNCVDAPSPRDLSFYEALAKSLAAVAPDFGAAEAWGSLTCAYWPVAAQGKPGPIHAAGSPTILVVGSTGDPATPYPWAQAIASQLDNSRLLTRSGTGHTGYFSSACIRRYVDQYFATLALPPKGTICPSD